jgi:hypothetical protein
MKNNKGFAKVILLILVLLIIGVGGYLIFSKKITKNNIEKKEDPISIAEKEVENNQNIDIKRAEDCGVVVMDDLNDKATKCFNLNFRSCSPAKVEVPTNAEMKMGYEVISPENELCKVRLTFLKYPKPDWIGKNMVCSYKNSIDFGVSNSPVGKCEGTLSDFISKSANNK